MLCYTYIAFLVSVRLVSQSIASLVDLGCLHGCLSFSLCPYTSESKFFQSNFPVCFLFSNTVEASGI